MAWHEEAKALIDSPQFLLHEEQEEGASDNKQAAWGVGEDTRTRENGKRDL